MDILQWLQDNLPALMLVAMRANGIFLLAPLFGNSRTPNQVKVILALILAFTLYPILPIDRTTVPEGTIPYLIMAIQELVMGLMYGWASQLIFEGMVLAGQFVGLQMGFAQANVLNPEADIQRPLLSEVYYLLSVSIFFAINGHHMLIFAFQRSFEVVPMGQFMFNGLVLERVTLLFAQIFIIGLMIAAPINGILTLLDMIMGLVAKTAPQMNVLILGFAIKIYVGLTTLVISLPFVFRFIREKLPELLAQVAQLL